MLALKNIVIQNYIYINKKRMGDQATLGQPMIRHGGDPTQGDPRSWVSTDPPWRSFHGENQLLKLIQKIGALLKINYFIMQNCIKDILAMKQVGVWIGDRNRGIGGMRGLSPSLLPQNTRRRRWMTSQGRRKPKLTKEQREKQKERSS